MSKLKLKNLGIIFEDSRFGGPHYQSINNYSFLKKKFNIKFLISKIENNIFKKKLYKKKIEFNDENIYYLSLKIKNFILYIFNFFKDLKKIKKFIKKENIDVVYIAGGSNNFKSIIACLHLPVKIIWHIHDSHSSLIIVKIFQILSPYCTKLIFASNKSKNFYKKFGGIKIKNIIIQSSVKYQKIKKNYNKKITIGTVGNFNKIKNQLFFLKLANEFKNNKKINFKIIGNVWVSQKEYYKKNLRYIKEKKLNNVKIIQNCKNVINHINEFDIFVLCSISESSPVALWEAMSQKKPIISTNVGDLSLFNKNHPCGYIINKPNVNKFKKAIQLINSSEDKKKFFSNNSFSIYKKNFTNEIYKKKLLNFLEDLT